MPISSPNYWWYLMPFAHCNNIILNFTKMLLLRTLEYSRTPLIRPPSESHWCGRIRGMVAREGFVYEQNAQSVTRNVVVWEGWSLVRVVVRQGFYCTINLCYVKFQGCMSRNGWEKLRRKWNLCEKSIMEKTAFKEWPYFVESYQVK